MTILTLAVACPTCAAQPGDGCHETGPAYVPGLTLPYFHRTRIEMATDIEAAKAQGATQPLTDELVLNTGLVD